MQERDTPPIEIDWVFCWRTVTGEIRAGARDAGMNGEPVPYQPSPESAETGLRTVVRGHVREVPPRGPRLDEQGAIARMCAFRSGYVTRPTLIPASTMRELRVLREAAGAAVRSGDASEWAFAAICGRQRVWWALHVAASAAVVLDLARRVDAPWTLDIREKPSGSWVKGSQIVVRDREQRTLETLEADTLFDEAPLPAIASPSRSKKEGPMSHEQRSQVVASWSKDPEILKEEIFGEWQEERPDGTREKFEDEWGLVTAVFGI